MKIMLCRDLGGECDQKLSAETSREMVDKMTKHVMENHPETAQAMEKMHSENPNKWGDEFQKKWEAAPEE